MRSNLHGIKAIFFDAGGTLVHLDSSCIRKLLRDELDIELSLDGFPRAQSLAMARVAELVAEGAGSTEQLKREFYTALLHQTGVSGEKLSDAVDCTFRLARAEMLWRKAEDGTARTLEELKNRGYNLAVVSNSDGRIENACEQAGIASYFDFFIDSFNVGVEKPDPEIFRLATQRAGVAPDEALYLGDLYWVDVVGARSAGLVPILYDPFDQNPQADCLRVRSINELPALIR
ncbi:MAG: HAD family hydrolase [Blastocatellia bacterium]